MAGKLIMCADDNGRLLSAGLESANEVGAALNRLDPGDPLALQTAARMIRECVAALVHDAVATVNLVESDRGSEWTRSSRAAEPVLSYTLPAGERPLGVLDIDIRGRVPGPVELLLLHNFATIAAAALGRISLQRDVRRKEDELTLLRQAGLLISSRSGLQETLDTILQMALEVTGARYGIFRLVDRKRKALVTSAIGGADLDRPAIEALPINATSVMGMVAKTKQPVMIADVWEAPWSRIYYPLDHSLQMRSELAVPLIGTGGELEGVLNLESPQVSAFTDADRHLLASLAGQAVIAIQEVRLLDALRDTAARLLTYDVSQALTHIEGLREELVNGDTEWDRKVDAILSQYAALARENATRQEALREAREARAVAETFAAMGDVAANVLHHLNNQVGTIPVRVEGIQDKCVAEIAANPYLAANLAEIERAALDAMQTVRQRLSLLRPIHVTSVAVADCLREAMRAARLPGNVLVEQIDQLAGLPPVLASHEGLVLVLLNLLDNAGEALGGHGRIVVSGTVENNAVELTVTDDGPGISPDIQARIFEFDFSGRQRAGTRNRLGFGLWWVKTLVARLGGSISVESDGRTGTTFRIRLPQAPSDSTE